MARVLWRKWEGDFPRPGFAFSRFWAAAIAILTGQNLSLDPATHILTCECV